MAFTEAGARRPCSATKATSPSTSADAGREAVEEARYRTTTGRGREHPHVEHGQTISKRLFSVKGEALPGSGLMASALGTRNAEHDHLMGDRVGGVSHRGLDVVAPTESLRRMLSTGRVEVDPQRRTKRCQPSPRRPPSPDRLHDPCRLAWTGVAESELDDRQEDTGQHGFRDERRAPSAGCAATARYFQVPYTPPQERPGFLGKPTGFRPLLFSSAPICSTARTRWLRTARISTTRASTSTTHSIRRRFSPAT